MRMCTCLMKFNFSELSTPRCLSSEQLKTIKMVLQIKLIKTGKTISDVII